MVFSDPGKAEPRSARLRRFIAFLLGILLLPTIPFLLIAKFIKRRKTSAVGAEPAGKNSP